MATTPDFSMFMYDIQTYKLVRTILGSLTQQRLAPSTARTTSLRVAQGIATRHATVNLNAKPTDKWLVYDDNKWVRKFNDGRNDYIILLKIVAYAKRGDI